MNTEDGKGVAEACGAQRHVAGDGQVMSGQNAMIGEPGALTPGRPGTIT